MLDAEGYFDTGDVATPRHLWLTCRSPIDPRMSIKSGGEWISSIELENLAVGHPKVAEAAVIGVPPSEWYERPLLIVVLGGKPGQTVTAGRTVVHFFDGKVAKWWMPDDVAFVAEIPHTATGKILKTALREQFRDYVLSTAAAQ